MRSFCNLIWCWLGSETYKDSFYDIWRRKLYLNLIWNCPDCIWTVTSNSICKILFIFFFFCTISSNINTVYLYESGRRKRNCKQIRKSDLQFKYIKIHLKKNKNWAYIYFLIWSQDEVDEDNEEDDEDNDDDSLLLVSHYSTQARPTLCCCWCWKWWRRRRWHTKK